MIDTVVSEFETVANAFVGCNKFIYGRLSEINTQRNGDEYPLILLESASIQKRGGVGAGGTRFTVNNKWFPRMKVYEFNLFAFDLWKQDEKNAKTLQAKQAEIELFLDQYYAELLSRVQNTTTKGFQFVDWELSQGIIAHDVHNDKIVQANYKLKVGLNVICDEGTFNY